MKTYAFPYGGAEWDSFIEIDLADEEAARLELSAKAKPRWRLDEDESISDILQKVTHFIVDENKRILGKHDIENDMGLWHVFYPESLQFIEE